VTALVTTQRLGRVLVATLARAPVNALDAELLAQLEAVLAQASADDEVTLLHLRSEQRAFCAGADLALMREGFASAQGMQAMTEVVRRMQRLFAQLEAAPVVTLAEISTAALGGGFELALACDLRVAAHEARLGLPEAQLGLVPGAGGTQRLTRLVGAGLAKRLILGAELLDGAQAERMGLVHWARPRAELAAFAAALAERIAAAPKAALAANKRCIAAAHDPGRDGFADEIRETRALYDDPQTRSRVDDFLAKR
jgi:enoyl-CoA hydratase/carnithine racemase